MTAIAVPGKVLWNSSPTTRSQYLFPASRASVEFVVFNWNSALF